MIFVGRKHEKEKITKYLLRGKNVIITGKFGIGRTSLVQEIAKEMNSRRRFLFVDFSQTPGKMSDTLMKELGISRRFRKSGMKMGYKSMRYRIATSSSRGNKPIIVFDNIARLTRPKNVFLRRLIEEDHFQFIAVCEHFLPAKELLLLKTQLLPLEMISLNYLPPEDIRQWLRLYSEKHHFNWPDTYIGNLTALTGGYPLGIVEMLRNQKTESIPHD